MKMRRRILFVISEDWAFISHRFGLAKHAISLGYDVFLLTRSTCHIGEIESAGITVIDWKLTRGSINVLDLLGNTKEVYRAISFSKPDVILAVAIKPIICTMTAEFFSSRSKLVACFGGLGYIFHSKRPKIIFLKRLIGLFLKISFKKTQAYAIVQNQSDFRYIAKIQSTNRVELIRGMGINTGIYRPRFKDEAHLAKRVILPARMLWDKGVGEFLSIAKAIKPKHPDIKFCLIGKVDVENMAYISKEELIEMEKSGFLEWLGEKKNMVQEYQNSSIVCFPSYHEGFPKVLVEAASCGLPVVCFDIPGCNDVVVDGKTGFLVPLGDVETMQSKVQQLIRDTSLHKKMSKNARKHAVKYFEETSVMTKFTSLLDKVSAP